MDEAVSGSMRIEPWNINCPAFSFAKSHTIIQAQHYFHQDKVIHPSIFDNLFVLCHVCFCNDQSDLLKT